MTAKHTKKNMMIRLQSSAGSREEKIMNTAKSFYGARFKSKVELALIDLLEPLYVALQGGSQQEVQAAISHSCREIRDLHRQALNQCPENGYSSPDHRVTVDQTSTDRCSEIDIDGLEKSGHSLISEEDQ